MLYASNTSYLFVTPPRHLGSSRSNKIYIRGRCIYFRKTFKRWKELNQVFKTQFHARIKTTARRLFDEFFGFEVSAEVQNLPRRQTQKTAHTEDAEEQDAAVGFLCGEERCIN